MLNRRVVMTGFGTLNPLAHTVEGFWDALIAGKSGIRRIKRFDPAPYTSQIGGEVQDWEGIPATYVPGRNIIFLSFAASYAEAIGAKAIFIGANAVDYSGYPDCRPEFIRSYQAMLARGLKTSLEGKSIKVVTPLIHLSKASQVYLLQTH